MCTIIKSDLFICFYLIFLFLKKFIFIKCICEKEKPINKNGECLSIYCTENEFKNKICSIDNDIIKTQWLNNFITFNEYRYRFTNMVINDEGDLILETSPEEINGQRLFYILKNNGKPYFKNNNNEEILSKSIVVLNGDEGALRYESQVFLIKINNDTFPENKQFLVSLSIYYGFMEIYDLDNNNITFSKILISDFSNYIIYSQKGSVIELNNKEYLYFFLAQNQNDKKHYIVLRKYTFYDNNINKYNIKEKCLIEEKKAFRTHFSRVVSAFKTENNKIIVFYINVNYKVELLNDNFNTIITKTLEFANNFNGENSLFFKCIHLKENIGIFIYYTDTYDLHPKLLIENIIDNDFINIFEIVISEYQYNTLPLLNDVIKINNKRFSFISTSQERLILYILLFDLYNNNKNIKIRFYKINIFNLYNYKIYNELSAINYNNYITLAFSACNSIHCDNKTNDEFFSTLLYFSYINGTDHNINITSYFLNQQNNDNDDDIYLNFPEHFKIENNIFGYQIMKNLKIVSIPNEINLYKIDDSNIKTKIKNGDECDSNMRLIISPKSVVKNNIIYFIEYQYQYSGPDYDTFNNYPDQIIDYPKDSSVSQKEEFNNEREIYFSKTLKIEFKLCNDNCKTCQLIGKSSNQTKCVECNDNLKFHLDENTSSNTCFSSDNNCPEDFPFLNIENNLKCEKSCNIETITNNKCIIDNYSIKSIKQIYSMFNDIISNEYNNENVILKVDDDLTFHLSNSLNEKEMLNSKKESNYNLSIIDLGECEAKLKKVHNIPEDISLIIFKVETVYDNTTIKNVQYEIYNPLTTVKITDLSPCENDKINIYVPTNLDNDTYSLYENFKKIGYDIFNPNDSFYNDICSQYTTVNNSDLTLNDRKELFYNEKQIFCQENCEYNGIDLDNYHAKCECPATSKNEITFEKQPFSGIEIITSFYEVIKFSNFLILKCFKLVFSSIGIKNNYGFIIILVLLGLLFIFMIIFLFTGMNKIKDQMSTMIYMTINKTNTVAFYEHKNLKYNNFKKIIFPPGPQKKKLKNILQKKNKKNISTKKTIKSNSSNKNHKKSKLSESLRKNTSNCGLNGKKSTFNFLINNKTLKHNSSLLSYNKIKKEKRKKIIIYSEFELDDLEYGDAIKYDKRTFFDFFCYLVKREHIIVFTFIYCNDLNLFCIKLSLFIFSISLDFTTNVLFFNDDSMHKIYLDYGKYNFISQIPQIVYSTVISEIFDVFFKFLSLSEKEIYEAKKITSVTKAVNRIKKLMRRIKIKFFLFYLISFLLMSFFWYFISAFCAVYKNTQAILFKDSLISFVISLIYPFALYLIPASLRIISLRASKKDQRLLYKLSNIFPLF